MNKVQFLEEVKKIGYEVSNIVEFSGIEFFTLTNKEYDILDVIYSPDFGSVLKITLRRYDEVMGRNDEGGEWFFPDYIKTLLSYDRTYVHIDDYIIETLEMAKEYEIMPIECILFDLKKRAVINKKMN
jgi:hypothetical protein